MKPIIILLGWLMIFSRACLPAVVHAEESAAKTENPEYLEQGLILWSEPLTGMVFVWLEGGCFMMGQDNSEQRELLRETGKESYLHYYSDELPMHEVCLDGFWLGRNEVTRKQWLLVMESSPFSSGRQGNYPADNISWQMAVDFSQRLEAKSTEKFALPTEAQWEFAARAGRLTPFYTGSTINTDQANFNGNHPYGPGGTKGIYRAGPLPVGTLPANQFGVYEMLGNVWEWCADWYDRDYYGRSPTANPVGPESGGQKVMRGGSWYTVARSLRAANRRGLNPAIAIGDAGFRVVCRRPPPERNFLLPGPDF